VKDAIVRNIKKEKSALQDELDAAKIILSDKALANAANSKFNTALANFEG